MAANKEMSEWIKFFTAAGIPPGPGAKYAVVFLDNRIQKSMLMDLTKEYLKEMGITIMGDIISILKYAKTAHIKYENEKPAITALSTAPDAKVEVKRQSTPGNRMLEHYMRKEGIMEATSSKVTVSPSMAVRLGAVPAGGNKKGSAGILADTAEVVPVKRPRMVKPEEEGGYVISMPKGSTPKTQKILEQKQTPQQQQPSAGDDSKKSSVFARLGSGSSTPTTKPSLPKTEASQSQSPGGSSIFSRLGGKRERVTSDSFDSVVEYQGVLKATPAKLAITTLKASVVKVTKPVTMSVTLGGSKMASASPAGSLQRRLGKPVASPALTGASTTRAKSLQARLGAPVAKAVTAASPARPAAAAAKPKVTVTIGGVKKTGIRPQSQAMMDRLGVQTPEVSTTTTHMDAVGTRFKVQDRLGGGQESPGIPAQGTVRLNPGKVAVKRSMRARLGAPTKPVSVSPVTDKQASMKQTVTVTLGGGPGLMQNRLGKAVLGASEVAARSGGKSAASAKILKRIGSPISSPVPAKQSTVRDRLGVMRAEATSTTPSVTVTMDGMKMAKRLAAPGAKSQKNVFSRLGS